MSSITKFAIFLLALVNNLMAGAIVYFLLYACPQYAYTVKWIGLAVYLGNAICAVAAIRGFWRKTLYLIVFIAVHLELFGVLDDHLWNMKREGDVPSFRLNPYVKRFDGRKSKAWSMPTDPAHDASTGDAAGSSQGCEEASTPDRDPSPSAGGLTETGSSREPEAGI